MTLVCCNLSLVIWLLVSFFISARCLCWYCPWWRHVVLLLLHFLSYSSHRYIRTNSLTPFICFSNIIATVLVITYMDNARWLPLLPQDGMFDGASAFNQNISGWDVSSGVNFVSGFGLCESLFCHLFGLLLYFGALFLLSCFVHAVFFIIVSHLIVIFEVKVSHNSSVFLISSLRYLWFRTSILHDDFPCFDRYTCLDMQRLLTKTLVLGMLAVENLL